MSEIWKKSHNISVLIYHYVCPAKYRKVVFDKEVDEIFERVPEVKKKLWGGELWTDGYMLVR